ncbi:bifunctional endo-1,4-beta-xylanase XylA-like isoform X2 [Telopea speciosissima]|uniref:bifunctional endo-1,4-beta-xylanase XylA-like isoform X2 n=1 Tax=Telopea speciosissima TaxID=54955 RepID=UPI001CC39224|nr:bifunctional endo-1,4-beta-xylanase XylA-like isoform X2 [Telopea speciosissima]
MDDRIRRQGGCESYHQDARRASTRSQYRKPPSGPWHPTVPTWEKKFCTIVGSVPWRKILEAKKVMPFHENVLKWNDSAGRQAFDNAKSRFWAEINEQEPLPFDKDDKEGKSTLVVDSLFLNQSVPCSGWGDAEEDPVGNVDDSSEPGLQVCVPNANNADNPWERECDWGNNTFENSTRGDPRDISWESNHREKNNNNWENPEPRNNASWGTWNENYRKRDGASQYMSWEREKDPVGTIDDSSEPGLQVSVHNANNADNPWERECDWGNNTLEDSTRGDPRGNSWESNQWEKNNNNWENPEPRNNASWRTWNENYRKRDGASQYMSRYKTSRFQGDYNQTDNGWKNGRGRKRVNLFYERPRVDKKPLASQRWNSIHSCWPISHRGSRESGNPWSWENSVS